MLGDDAKIHLLGDDSEVCLITILSIKYLNSLNKNHSMSKFAAFSISDAGAFSTGIVILCHYLSNKLETSHMSSTLT